MKIVMLKSSPHKNGSSNYLAEQFQKGAEEAGHEVTAIDVAHGEFHPCLGCDVCGMSGPCCQRDDMEKVRKSLLSSDMVVFVTPLYYFGMSAQLKTVIDRFYSFTGRLSGKGLKAALLAAAWDNNSWTMKDLSSHYQTLCRYLHFENMGMVLGTGCGALSMTKASGYPEKAYQLGKGL
ncbi:MAG: flavodoxin family protein [Clostridium sp.]|nr:flavodoxin family protein [Clostridium sp.]